MKKKLKKDKTNEYINVEGGKNETSEQNKNYRR